MESDLLVKKKNLAGLKRVLNPKTSGSIKSIIPSWRLDVSICFFKKNNAQASFINSTINYLVTQQKNVERENHLVKCFCSYLKAHFMVAIML